MTNDFFFFFFFFLISGFKMGGYLISLVYLLSVFLFYFLNMIKK